MTAQKRRTIHLLEIPEQKTAEDAMLQIAGAKRRVHTRPKWEKRYWVESRYTPRGWFAILWPWPEENGMQCRFRQRDAGQTLPFYATRDGAVELAWMLAEMKEDDAIKSRIYPWRGL